jgi:hypothetical protein
MSAGGRAVSRTRDMVEMTTGSQAFGNVMRYHTTGCSLTDCRYWKTRWLAEEAEGCLDSDVLVACARPTVRIRDWRVGMGCPKRGAFFAGISGRDSADWCGLRDGREADIEPTEPLGLQARSDSHPRLDSPTSNPLCPADALSHF